MPPRLRSVAAIAVAAALLLLGMSVPRAPVEEPAEALPIGGRLGHVTFTDIRFLPRSIDELGEDMQVSVLVFTTTTCPLVQRYLPRLQELSQEYAGRGVRFAAINVGPEDSIQDIAWQAMQHKVSFPFLKDMTGEGTALLGATRTPQVVVLDADRTLRYRGRIDSQYRLGGARPDTGRRDLVEAIEDVLAGREVRVPETPVDGCVVTPPRPVPADDSLTYAADIAPIIARHCIECHRPGAEGPFPLLSYENVAGKAAMIAEVVSQGRMPPWFAHPEFGQFINERGLSRQERDAIVAWARAGAPAGDLAEAPEPPQLTAGTWSIGEPDLVITALTRQRLPATGFVPYRYVILPHVFTHDTWVQGIEIMPSNARVVHHANLGFATLGEEFNPARNFLTGRVPGGRPMDLRDGQALLIPAGSVLGLQIHYVTTGREETDRISVGLRFAREPVRQQVRYVRLANTRFAIPPGDPSHKVSSSRTLQHDVTLLGLFMHMHLRGRDATFLAHLPDGNTQTLLVIPNYSFDWQLSYRYAPETKRLPAGTRLEAISHFDNSAFNPYNPDPSATVRYGPQTHDEMMDGFVFYTIDGEDLGLQIDPATGRRLRDGGAPRPGASDPE